jgi:hypothetical protein
MNTNIDFVNQRHGKPHVRWTIAILIACGLGFFTAAAATGVYFLLTRTFSFPAAMIGFCGAFITVGSVIVRAMKMPATPD